MLLVLLDEEQVVVHVVAGHGPLPQLPRQAQPGQGQRVWSLRVVELVPQSQSRNAAFIVPLHEAP